MNTDIFKMGLSHEALTLFLILTYLGGRSGCVTLEAIESNWKSSSAAMQAGMDELQQLSILTKQDDVVILAPPTSWSCNV